MQSNGKKCIDDAFSMNFLCSNTGYPRMLCKKLDPTKLDLMKLDLTKVSEYIIQRMELKNTFPYLNSLIYHVTIRI